VKSSKMIDQKYDLQSSQYLSELSVNRLIVMGLLFCIAFIIITIKMFVLVLGENDEYVAFEAAGKFFHDRKEIIDRNGELLAVNLSTASLYAKPKYIFDKEKIAKSLTQIFPDLKYEDLLKSFYSKKKFLWVKRNLSPKEQYAVNNLGSPGLVFEDGQRRVYLQGNTMAHILGYVDVDGKGIAGIEKSYDAFLTDNKKTGNLQLSIDMRVQNIVHDALSTAMIQYKMDGAVGLVMDVNNGELISMVSLPDFNPHLPNKASVDSLFNRASLGVYEIGSVFKVLSFASALDSKHVKTNDVYFVRNPLKAGRFTIKDYKYKQDWMTVPEILMYSSNIGTAKMIMELGIEKQQQYLKQFGIMDKLTLELPEKGIPMFPSDRSWGNISAMTISYGHGIAVTAIHFAQAMSSIVNGGNFYNATIIKDKNNNPVRKVINPNTSITMNKLLRAVVKFGTGRKTDIPGYFVGGKSGSADKAEKGGYNRNSKLSTFAGAFPMNDPKYLVIIMLDAPKAKANYMTTGGYGVAPIVKEVITKIGPVLKIAPNDINDLKINNDLFIEHSVKDDSQND
jgi:cell division protein FtsI (penicillin-binding protein 3)